MLFLLTAYMIVSFEVALDAVTPSIIGSTHFISQRAP
jgi:hypothetical protein